MSDNASKKYHRGVKHYTFNTPHMHCSKVLTLGENKRVLKMFVLACGTVKPVNVDA